MNKGANKISVIFRISGLAADVNELAPRLMPSKGKVELRPAAVRATALPEAWWAIEIVRLDQESTETVIAETVASLEPIHATLLDIADDPRFHIELDCTVEINEERPVLEVPPPMLRQLGKLNVALGFDVYDYRK